MQRTRAVVVCLFAFGIFPPGEPARTGIAGELILQPPKAKRGKAKQPAPAAAKRPEVAKRLTIEQIFGSGDFHGRQVAARWLADSSGYTATERSTDPVGGQDIVFYDASTGRRDVLVPAGDLVVRGASVPLTISGYQWSNDRSRVLIFTNTRRLWRRNTRGDYWVLDRSSRELTQVGRGAPPSSLMFAKFAPDGNSVAYVRDQSLYIERLADGKVTTLAESRSPNVINGTFDWVYEEELSLRDGFRFSPDGERIAYWQLDTSGVRQFPLVNYTDSLYPEVTRFAYPRAGETNSAARVGVVGIGGGKTTWLKVPGDPRNHYIARMEWTPGGKHVMLQQLNRLQNRNVVYLGDPAGGDVQAILTDRDDAWVEVVDEIEWLAGDEQFTWISERDGWRQVYIASCTGEPLRQLTVGPFDAVKLLRIDRAAGAAYFIASPDDPTQRYLYRISLDPMQRTARRITPDDTPGTHHYNISPDGRYAVHTYSTFDTPPVTDLVTLPDHKRVRWLAENKPLRNKIAALRREPTEFFRTEVDGGHRLDGWCIKPPKMKRGKKYPLLIYVYGEPAGQTVLDAWKGRQYLWHLMLAQRGYVVMSFDNRGTPAPRGRAWRKAIYRQVGILAPAEQASAVRSVLSRRDDLDPKRVGVWGWSGGGSMSLCAIFKFPDLYHTAMVVAPVTNQRYYDTIYQERYMGLPHDNVDGYRGGSSIHFAKNLQGNLLLIHGTRDDNCHYQGTEALANLLIRHNKHFTMMAYPNRSHSIHEGTGTTRHLYTLMTRYLEENLPPGPRGTQGKRKQGKVEN